MKWIPDPTGRFNERPFYTEAELDYECEDMVAGCLEERGLFPFCPPLDTDTLTVLLEKYASEVDLYADLAKQEGADVEGMTVFQRKRMPRIAIDKRLSEAKSQNRLRTTLAHELFHARFHRVLWELYWSGKLEEPRCHEGQILMASTTDWYEWQAGYGSGAILVPRTAVIKLYGNPAQIAAASSEGQRLVLDVLTRFGISADAARVRLVQLGFLVDSQRSMFPVGA